MFIRLSSHLDTQKSLSIDSSTSATQIVFEFDGVAAGAGDKSVEKSSKGQRIVNKSKKPQKSGEFAKVISSEEGLSKHHLFVN